jgi:uncharacterized protein (TIGR02271 family)
MTISDNDLSTVLGQTAYGSDGDKIGTVGQVYLDDQSGRPEWVTVTTGLFGTKQSFVPVGEADVSGDGLRLPYDKDTIKGAPQVDPEQGHLSEGEEAELYRYYGLADRHGVADGTGNGYAGDQGQVDDLHDQEGTVGHDTSGPNTDSAMTRSEERLRVGTQQQETGKVRLRKYLVTEQQQVSVPVEREEVRLEREPITEANRDAAMSGADLSEEVHEVTLHEERPVVQKETVPVERVRLDTDTVTEDVQVNEEVRKEQIDTEGLEGTDVDSARPAAGR